MSDQERETGDERGACVADEIRSRDKDYDGVNNKVSKTTAHDDLLNASSKESEIESERSEKETASRYNLRSKRGSRGVMARSKTRKSFLSDDSDEDSATKRERFELSELKQMRQSLEGERAVLEAQNDELEREKRDLRRTNDALEEEVMKLTRETRAKTLEKERKGALLEEVKYLVNDLRGASNQIEQERVQIQEIIEEQERDIERLDTMRQRKIDEKCDIEESVHDLNRVLEKAVQRKEEVERQLEVCIGEIREAIKNREEYEKKEEKVAKEWEAKLRDQAQARYKEFKAEEDKGRKRRLLELERTDKEFEKQITQLEQRIQAKKDRVEGLKKSLDNSKSDHNPRSSKPYSSRFDFVESDSQSRRRRAASKTRVEESSTSESDSSTGEDELPRGRQSNQRDSCREKHKQLNADKELKKRGNKQRTSKKVVYLSNSSSGSDSETNEKRKSRVRKRQNIQTKKPECTCTSMSESDSETGKSSPNKSDSRNKERKVRKKRDIQTKKLECTSMSESDSEKGRSNLKKSFSRKKEGRGRKKRAIQTKKSGYVSISESDSEKESKPTSARMKPQKFSGNGVFADFLSQFEACRAYNRWSEKESAFQLFSCCQDDALNRLTTDGVTPQTCSYSDLVEVLEREFGPRECKSSYIMELNQVKQRPGESARELGNRIKKLASLAFRGKDRGSKATREEMSLNSFTLALHRKDIRDAVFGAEFSSLKQAIDKAEYLESYHKRDYESEHEMPARRREKHVSFARKLETTDSKLSGSDNEMEERIVQRLLGDINVRTLLESAREKREGQATVNSSPGPIANPSPSFRSMNRPNQAGTGPMLCYYCGDPSHMRNNCPRRPQVAQGGGNMRCHNCNSPGHGWRECGYPPLCFVCHQEGHLARDCSVKSGNEGRPNHRPQGRPQTMRGQGGQRRSMSPNPAQMRQ